MLRKMPDQTRPILHDYRSDGGDTPDNRRLVVVVLFSLVVMANEIAYQLGIG